MSTLSRLPPVAAARDLYAGRGFGLAKAAAVSTSARLYVISAGLGLVSADRSIPTYGLTVSPRAPDSVSSRVRGRFDPTSWWRAVSRSPASERMSDVLASCDGLILLALTAPYASLISGELEALGVEVLGRMRIFGQSLGSILPASVSACIMPYDGRLDAAMPGTRTDFPHRALRHFSQGATTDASVDAAESAREVEKLLSGHEAPLTPIRTRASDGDLIALISSHLREGRSLGRILRLVRDVDGMACEQARFGRLYRQALARDVAA